PDPRANRLLAAGGWAEGKAKARAPVVLGIFDTRVGQPGEQARECGVGGLRHAALGCTGKARPAQRNAVVRIARPCRQRTIRPRYARRVCRVESRRNEHSPRAQPVGGVLDIVVPEPIIQTETGAYSPAVLRVKLV